MMIKLGICTIEQLKKEISSPVHRRIKQVAIPLLHEVLEGEDVERMRERIFLELADDRGAYKRTHSSRFDDFDVQVHGVLARILSPDSEPIVLDCGVSDGRTAVDYFLQLSKHFSQLSYVGTDYDPYLKFVRLGAVTVVFSSNNEPLQLIHPPFVFNLQVPERWLYYPVNTLALMILKKKYLQKAKLMLSRNNNVETITLFCQAALDLSRKDKRFQLAQLNILDPFQDSFDIVRMMNLLNPTYFSLDEFETIVWNVRGALKENGLFIMGSNQEAGTEVKGGIYRMSDGHFVELKDFNAYPPLREIILSDNPKNHA